MKPWISEYINAQKAALDSIPAHAVEQLIKLMRQALHEDRQIFVLGNGGSASNASHFATDLGKGSSDKVGRRFRCLSLNDNVSWMTALANDYAYSKLAGGFLQAAQAEALQGMGQGMDVDGSIPRQGHALLYNGQG